jgi:hypothetical protein
MNIGIGISIFLKNRKYPKTVAASYVAQTRRYTSSIEIELCPGGKSAKILAAFCLG